MYFAILFNLWAILTIALLHRRNKPTIVTGEILFVNSLASPLSRISVFSSSARSSLEQLNIKRVHFSILVLVLIIKGHQRVFICPDVLRFFSFRIVWFVTSSRWRLKDTIIAFIEISGVININILHLGWLYLERRMQILPRWNITPLTILIDHLGIFIFFRWRMRSSLGFQIFQSALLPLDLFHKLYILGVILELRVLRDFSFDKFVITRAEFLVLPITLWPFKWAFWIIWVFWGPSRQI